MQDYITDIAKVENISKFRFFGCVYESNKHTSSITIGPYSQMCSTVQSVNCLFAAKKLKT